VCAKVISYSEEAIQSNDTLFHPDCFSCGCSKGLYNQKHFIRGAELFCEDCHTDNFGQTCKLCKEMINGSGVLIGTDSFHSECSKCAVCKEKAGDYQKISLGFTLYGILLCSECEKL
jgi:hypothetical protein